MTKDKWGKAGIAALVLLAPGGFILGGTLLVRHYRRKQAEKSQTTDQ